MGKDNTKNVKNYPGVNLGSDPIHTTHRLYKEVILVVLKKSRQHYEFKDYDSSIELLNSVIPLAQFALELVEVLMLYKLIATIEFARKAFEKALKVCHLVVYMCANTSALCNIRLEMLKMAGLCRMRLMQYQEAIHAWKLCFEHALRTENDTAEVEVYEQMSYCYFYLGQMKKAEYFNTRYRSGVLEDENSQVRSIYASLRKNTEKKSSSFWDRDIQYVADISWNGENLFDLFYKNFLEDAKRREKIIKGLMKGQIYPIFEKYRSRLSRHIAIYILKRVGKYLKRLNERKRAEWSESRQSPVALPELTLQPQWRKAYFVSRRKKDAEDIVNLRF